MNGFTLISESYKKAIEQGKMTKELAEPEIRIFEFLATCDTDDFCRLVDSSAFNEIIKAYLRMSIKNSDIGEDAGKKILNELDILFNYKTANEVLAE